MEIGIALILIALVIKGLISSVGQALKPDKVESK